MSSAFRGLSLVSLFCFIALTCAQSAPVVETTLGKVKGSLLKTEKGLDVYAFRGIRYAEPPIGEKRFRPPTAVPKWEDVLDATRDGAICPQHIKRVSSLMQVSEDCLFLNVYSRNLTKANTPVIVYIYGGSNIGGSGHSLSAFGPRYLLDEDLVLVTLNYRLGPFGFLSLGTPEVPGNYAYLDQVMALQWIHDHIANFGGNPESVTMLGMSAGGMAVSLHMGSPLSKSLFHRAIIMSGSATSELVLDSVKWSQKLAHETSCPMFNPEDIVSCLRELPWETIIKVCDTWELYGIPNMKWGYQVDGYFMPTKLTELFETGNFSRMPILTGLSKDEFTFSFHNQENNTGLFNDISLNFDKYASELFMHDLSDAKEVKKLKNFYLGNRTINDQNLTHFGSILSDSFIGHGVHRLVDLAREYVDVYYYRFDYAGSHSTYVQSDGVPRGVSHGDELLFLTNTLSSFTKNDKEWFMVEEMVGMVSSFAHNGFPQEFNEIKWYRTNKTHLHTMYIDSESKMGYEPFTERFRLWDTLFPVNSGRSLFSSGLVILLIVLVQFFC